MLPAFLRISMRSASEFPSRTMRATRRPRSVTTMVSPVFTSRMHWLSLDLSSRIPIWRSFMAARMRLHYSRCDHIIVAHREVPGADSFLVPLALYTNSGAITRVMVESSLISTCSEGPAVSLKGSPTVSPTTAALCASERLPPYWPVSMNFLALSQAPPPLFIMVASRMPVMVPTISRGHALGAHQVDGLAADHGHAAGD